jgi:hypothetical protein
VEFSVPASVENLELSVPTHLVLTFCKEKTEFCIGMQGKGPFVAQTVPNQNRKNTSRKLIVHRNLFCCAGRWESSLSNNFLTTQNEARRAGAFEKKNRKNHGSEFRKLMKLKKLARYARLGKLKANSFAVELGG